MNKSLVALVGVGFAVSAAASEGFRFATFSGERNYSSEVWNSTTLVDSPTMLYSEGNNYSYNNKTFAYASYMLFEANTTYKFRAFWDDYAAVKVDGTFIINTTQLGTGYGSVVFETRGYHRIELGVSNGGGYYGSDPNNGYVFLGIEYSVDNGQTWRRFQNRADDPCRFLSSRISVNSEIRESDPTILDAKYIVYSGKPVVKVRVLAFEDGQRSFVNVVRPETFVDGTGVNVGDNIAPNVEHKISWRVSSDWKTKLAKVKFEVLAKENELLPLETMTIPASDQYGKMKITWNAISESQVFDALLWLYADKDPGLTLVDGKLKNNGLVIAEGASIKTTSGGGYSYYDEKGNYVGYHLVETSKPAPEYIFSKMGYSLLTGAPLTYANQETRLGLSPSGARQYGYKIVE